MAAVVAAGMGFRKPIRGSSARGGHKALLELTRLVKSNPRMRPSRWSWTAPGRRRAC